MEPRNSKTLSINRKINSKESTVTNSSSRSNQRESQSGSLSKVCDSREENVGVARRQYCKALETREAVQRMKKALPVYNLEEIRFLKLPYHEALLINLLEKGFHSTAAYINELIVYQESLETSHTQLSNSLDLKSNVEKLNVLAEGLQKSETCHGQERFEDEHVEFLRVAIHFAFKESLDWWWLGFEMMVQSIHVSSLYPSGKKKCEALSRFVFGKYLVQVVKEYGNATAQLEIVRDLSKNKNWYCRNLFPEHDTLYVQANELLYYCFIDEVENLISKSRYQEAIEIAKKAQKSASIACKKVYESRALLLKGISEIGLSQGANAINTLSRAYTLQELYGTMEGKFEIKIHMLVAAMMENQTDMTLDILMALKKIAEEINLPLYLAKMYKQLGFYLVKVGEPGKGYTLLKEALKAFSKAGMKTEETNQTKSLQAYAFGLIIFPQYTELLVKAHNNCKNLNVLLRWKDERAKFWTDVADIGYKGTVENFISKSIKNMQAENKSALINSLYFSTKG